MKRVTIIFLSVILLVSASSVMAGRSAPGRWANQQRLSSEEDFSALKDPIFAREGKSASESEKEIMRVVVVDSPVQGFRAWNDEEEMYQRIKRNFTKVFEKKEWPVTIKFERWGAGIPDDGLQLRVWFNSLEEETLNDLVFRAWVNLREDGVETADFGIITVTTYPRPGRNVHDTLDEITALAAEEVAKKLNENRFKKS